MKADRLIGPTKTGRLMPTVQEALPGAQRGQGGRPTGQQVHRYTRTARGREGAFWQPIERRHRSRLIAAAERYDRAHRLTHRQARNGRENGALGHVGIEVLRSLLFDFLDTRTGRLDPAIATIAERIGRSIDAVSQALKRLKAHGFLDWLRRYVPTGNAGLRGPQVKQTSNAYRLMLPAQISALLATPAPDEDTYRRDAEADAHQDMLAQLPLGQRMDAIIDNPELARLLASLGAGIEAKERDSAKEHESQQL